MQQKDPSLQVQPDPTPSPLGLKDLQDLLNLRREHLARFEQETRYMEVHLDEITRLVHNHPQIYERTKLMHSLAVPEKDTLRRLFVRTATVRNHLASAGTEQTPGEKEVSLAVIDCLLLDDSQKE